jgi:hypothetical protein
VIHVQLAEDRLPVQEVPDLWLAITIDASGDLAVYRVASALDDPIPKTDRPRARVSLKTARNHDPSCVHMDIIWSELAPRSSCPPAENPVIAYLCSKFDSFGLLPNRKIALSHDDLFFLKMLSQ